METQEWYENMVDGVCTDIAGATHNVREHVTYTSTLGELGAESLDIRDMILRLERRFTITLNPGDIVRDDSCGWPEISVSHLVNCVHVAIQKMRWLD